VQSRTVSAREPGVRGAGAAVPGSATAHSTLGPGLEQAEPDRPPGPGITGPGRACRSALATSSDTTIAICGLHSVIPQRREMATVKSRRRGPIRGPGRAHT
jgi:hypothetical protein